MGLVQEEFKRLGEKLKQDFFAMERRIEKLEKEQNIEWIQKALD